MNSITLKFAVAPGATHNLLNFTARLNGEVIFDQRIDQCYQVEHTFDDSAVEKCVLEFELSGKLPEHTRINDQGEIVEDSVIHVKNIEIEGIDINQLFYEKSQYTHNFNGSGAAHTENFYGVMGCNGVVRFEFTSPFYLWLLENI